MSEHLYLVSILAFGPLCMLHRRTDAPIIPAGLRVFPPSSVPFTRAMLRLSLIPLKERRSWNGLPLSTKRST